MSKKIKEYLFTLRLTHEEAMKLGEFLDEELESDMDALMDRGTKLDDVLSDIKIIAQIARKLSATFYWSGRYEAKKKKVKKSE